ncbi:MAG: tRNA pseudouridine(55) synthase TruB [Cyanobacteriota bacterium ELA615]
MIGFINLNKPKGITSHDCVYRVRKLTKTKRVGHGGTLDPAASGVLSIALGGATRLLNYLPDTKKYRALIQFGLVTSTDDLEGEIIAQRPANKLTLEMIEPYLNQFKGLIKQIPPAYSAISVDGERLYQKARRGEIFTVPERQVSIYDLKILDWQEGDYPQLSLEITCGSGTYIRSIARDLGESLNTGATLAGLVRLENGGFNLSESISLEELSRKIELGEFSLISPEIALKHLSKIELSSELAKDFCLGRKIELKEAPSSQRVLVYSNDNFLGMGTVEDLQLLPKIVLFSHT